MISGATELPSHWEIIVPPGYASGFLKKFSALLAKLSLRLKNYSLGNFFHHYVPKEVM